MKGFYKEQSEGIQEILLDEMCHRGRKNALDMIITDLRDLPIIPQYLTVIEQVAFATCSQEIIELVVEFCNQEVVQKFLYSERDKRWKEERFDYLEQ